MEIDVALLADAATIDAAGKLNILGVFDRLQVAGFPAQHPRISLVLRFRGGIQDVGNHEVQIALSDPKGDQVFGIDGQLQVGPGPAEAGGSVRLPHVINLDGIVFKTQGNYVFDVGVDGSAVVSVPLLVTAPSHGPAAQA